MILTSIWLFAILWASGNTGESRLSLKFLARKYGVTGNCHGKKKSHAPTNFTHSKTKLINLMN